MTEDTEAEYGLLVSFPDQSPSFVHGYEAGILDWRMMYGVDTEIRQPVHVANEEVIRNMCAAYGWEVTFKKFEPTGDGLEYSEWLDCELRRLGKRRHLSVVK